MLRIGLSHVRRFPDCRGGGAVGCAQGRGFILPGGFGGAFLVVSVLGVVCDCHLWLVLQCWGRGCWWFLRDLWVLFGLGVALSGLLGGLWAVSGAGGSVRAPIAFRVLSCWGASVALCLWFWFWPLLRSRGGGGYWWFLWPGGPFPGCWGAYGLCPGSRASTNARRARSSPSEVYPAGKLR